MTRRVHVFEFYWGPPASYPGPHLAFVKGFDAEDAEENFRRQYAGHLDPERIRLIEVLDHSPILMLY